MPNIASLLKEEIARVARKQLRSETETLKKASSHYRSEIAQLKRRIDALERQLKRSSKGTPSVRSTAPAVSARAAESDGRQVRYSAKSLRSQRRRLGLSAADLARLLDVSALSVYKWEGGNTRPRPKQIEAIAALRDMGRRDAQKRLEEMGG
jgi:ribosome-binding protein aMBF1 (putative translation factor)